MADITRGIEIWREVAESLNTIITTTGKKIDINNPTIWSGFLHRFDNDDWEDALAAVALAVREDPTLARPWHERNITTARSLLLKSTVTGKSRILDTKPYKKTAWATIMTMRELWNAVQEINLPNEDVKASKARRNKITVETDQDATRITIWHNLFESAE